VKVEVFMLVLHGVYRDGKVEITDKNIPIKNQTPVEITVLDVEKITKKNFSFRESRILLKNYRGKLSDAVISERRES
jgi:hypothetical protein